jgi:hypothetical protein
MRLVDEITERPAPQALPAPSGPRALTGPVPLTGPASIPPPATSTPVLPYLPPVQPKVAEAATGPVPTTLLTEAMLILSANPAQAATEPPKRKRKRKRLIVLAVVVLVPTILAVVFRGSALVERITGKGYDTNPLPTHSIDRPVFTGAEYTTTTQLVAITDGLPTNYWETGHHVVNYTTSTAKSTVDGASASIMGGTIGTPQGGSHSLPVYLDQKSVYVPGKSESEPWTRQPYEPGWRTRRIFSTDSILMYQDVIDLGLRNEVPISVLSETRHDTPVTTYSYTFTFADFYESAPTLFELFRVVDGNAAGDAKVNVTVSLDDQGVVRYLDVDVDYHSVLEHRAKADVGTQYPYRYTIDVIKLTDKPDPVDLPTNTVNPTTTTTPPTLPVVTP